MDSSQLHQKIIEACSRGEPSELASLLSSLEGAPAPTAAAAAAATAGAGGAECLYLLAEAGVDVVSDRLAVSGSSPALSLLRIAAGAGEGEGVPALVKIHGLSEQKWENISQNGELMSACKVLASRACFEASKTVLSMLPVLSEIGPGGVRLVSEWFLQPALSSVRLTHCHELNLLISYLISDCGARFSPKWNVSPLVRAENVRKIVPRNTYFAEAALNDSKQLRSNLECGLDPNMKTENGMTLLHWACAGDANETFHVLLQFSAEYETRTVSGFTPLFYSMHPSPKIVEGLVDVAAGLAAAAPVPAEVVGGASVVMLMGLHVAVAKGAEACIDELLGEECREKVMNAVYRIQTGFLGPLVLALACARVNNHIVKKLVTITKPPQVPTVRFVLKNGLVGAVDSLKLAGFNLKSAEIQLLARELSSSHDPAVTAACSKVLSV